MSSHSVYLRSPLSLILGLPQNIDLRSYGQFQTRLNLKAFAIADNYQITDIVDENGTDPSNTSGSGSDNMNNATSIPEGIMVGATYGVLGLVVIVALVVGSQKKKNQVNLNTAREKQ